MASAVLDDAVDRLRAAGALFAYLHGSQAAGTATAGSDVDLVAVFPDPAPASFEVARVRWEARTRRIYSDEKYRIDRSHREFLEAVRRG